MNLRVVFMLVLSVLLATTSNRLGKYVTESWDWRGLLLLLPLSYGVFLSFGALANMGGLAIASLLADSLLTLATVGWGLVILKEWQDFTAFQWTAFSLILSGFVLLLIIEVTKSPSA